MLPVVFWIIIAAVAIAIDIATSNFLFVWFATGALAAMIGEVVGISFGSQVIVFLIVNLITISFGYPWAKKRFKASVKKIPLMEETYVGRIMIAEEDIEKRAKAKAKVDGIYWTIQNTDEKIKAGEKYKIIGIDGIKLIIKKEEES